MIKNGKRKIEKSIDEKPYNLMRQEVKLKDKTLPSSLEKVCWEKVVDYEYLDKKNLLI